MNYKKINARRRSIAYNGREAKRALKASGDSFSINDILNDYGNIDRGVSLDDFRIGSTQDQDRVAVLREMGVKTARQCEGFEKNGRRWSPLFSDDSYFSKIEAAAAFNECEDKELKAKALNSFGLYAPGIFEFEHNQINPNNYHTLTAAVFMPSDDKVLLKQVRKDFDVKSKSGSRYVLIKINEAWHVVRYANHWGVVASCLWSLSEGAESNRWGYTMGICKLSEFKRITADDIAEEESRIRIAKREQWAEIDRQIAEAQR